MFVSIVEDVDHFFDFHFILFYLEEILIDVCLLPFEYFLVALLLFGDCALEETYFLLVAIVKLVNDFAEMLFIGLQLFYLCLERIGLLLWIVIVVIHFELYG